MKSSFVKLSLIAASLASVFMFASCNKPDNEETGNPELTITSPENDTIKVAIAGGPCEITYTLKNPVEGVNLQVEAAEGIDWITDIDLATEGKITFNVASNEGQQPRETTLTIQYDYIQETVVVAQEGDESALDNEFKASVFTGYYYGDRQKTGTANYYFYLSDKGFIDGVMMEAEASYYLIDLYAPTSEDAANAFIQEGTYTFDLESTKESGTFTNLCCLKQTDFSGLGTSYDFEEGTLVVTKDGDNWNFELTVTIEGETHHVVYNGAQSFADLSPSDEWTRPDGDYSAVTGDMTITPESVSARYTGFEDGGNLAIEFVQGNTILNLSFMAANTEGTMIPGRYIVTGTLEPGTIEFGTATIFFGMVLESGSYLLVDGQTYGFISGGTVEVNQTAENTFSFEFNLQMEGQYNLTGTWEGPVEIQPYEG
ncbi:uncharacterized protein BN796_00173 [Alistipes sp. CAG:831]|nr:uncharacterized protein BN796_00173 [Alistipes sp. CAG:831]